MNGAPVENEHRIFVSRYVNKKDRKTVFESMNASTQDYTNLYVKNFSSSVTEERLRKIFEVQLLI